MRRETAKRVLLYGFGTAVVSGLIWAGFWYPKSVEADPGTKLAIAELHLKFAQVIPEKDRQGNPVPFRAQQLAAARKILAQVEREAPGLAITAEFSAFAAWIEGDMAQAEAAYRRVLERSRDDPELHRRTLLNIAQVCYLQKAYGRAEEALASIPAGGRDTRWYLLAARIANARGRESERDAAFERAWRSAGSDLDAQKFCTSVAFEWSHDKALSCLESIEHKDAEVWYRIAALKVEAGDFDRGRDALDRSHHADPKRLAGLISTDREFWKEQEGRGFKSRYLAAGGVPAGPPR